MSPSVARASPTIAERPGAPAHAASTPTGAPEASSRSTSAADVGHAGDVGFEDVGAGGRRHLRVRRGFDEAVPQRAELEEVEEVADLVDHPAAHEKRVDVDIEGHVTHERRGARVQPDAGFALGQAGPQLGRALVEVGVDAVERAVVVDQLGRRLLPDARHPRQVVGGVAAQRRVLRVVARVDTGALPDPGLVVEDVVAHAAAVVQHPHVGILDQLVRVAVTRHDDHVLVAVARLGGQRGDDVVGLEAGDLQDRDVEGRHHLAHEPHLLAEDVGSLLPTGLVVVEELVAERRLGTVEGDGDAVGTMVLEQVDQHRGEPEDGVRDLPGCGRHVRRQGEEGAVGERVAVDQHHRRHDGRNATGARLAPSPEAQPVACGSGRVARIADLAGGGFSRRRRGAAAPRRSRPGRRRASCAGRASPSSG